MSKGTPMHKARSRQNTSWTAAQRLQQAQRQYEYYNGTAKITLKPAPWEKEEKNDGLDNTRFRDVLR